jgi:hypothetical protein
MLLSKFQCLVNLGVSHISAMDIDLDVLDLEHETVMRWGYIVPSLQFCTLPSGSFPPFFFPGPGYKRCCLGGTRWSRYRPDAWFPDRGGPNADTKAQWLFRAIVAVKFPLDMYADIHDVEGQALMSKLRELRDRGVEYPLLVLGESSGVEEADLTTETPNVEAGGHEVGGENAEVMERLIAEDDLEPGLH